MQKGMPYEGKDPPFPYGHVGGPNEFPYKWFTTLGIVHIVLGCIGMACAITKFDATLCDDVTTESDCVTYPGVIAYGAVILLCCAMFTATGFVGTCMYRNHARHILCLGTSFYGLAVICMVLACFVCLAAGAEAGAPEWHIELLGGDSSLLNSYGYKYVPWILLVAGIVELILAIITIAVWCWTYTDIVNNGNNLQVAPLPPAMIPHHQPYDEYEQSEMSEEYKYGYNSGYDRDDAYRPQPNEDAYDKDSGHASDYYNHGSKENIVTRPPMMKKPSFYQAKYE